MMRRADLEEYVVALRQEFAAYEASVAASEHAVVLLRQLDHAEALLELLTAEPAVDSAPSRRAPAPIRRAGAPRGRRPRVPWDVLAAIWNDAVAEHRSPHQAFAELAAEHGVAASTAKNWPARLRERGLIAQRGEDTPTEPDAAPLEWDLPKRRERPDTTEAPRRAEPRAHGNGARVIA